MGQFIEKKKSVYPEPHATRESWPSFSLEAVNLPLFISRKAEGGHPSAAALAPRGSTLFEMFPQCKVSLTSRSFFQQDAQFNTRPAAFTVVSQPLMMSQSDHTLIQVVAPPSETTLFSRRFCNVATRAVSLMH